MLEQAVLRFCISLNEIFYKEITFTVINKYGTRAVVQIAAVRQPIFRVTC